VLGSIHIGLIESGQVGLTTTGKEEIAQKWIGETSFVIERSIPALPSKKHHLLRCSGVDTASEIRLDGILLGSTCSEFVNWDFPMPQPISPTSTLQFLLQSPIAFCQAQSDAYYKKYGYKVESSHYVNGISNFNFLRKTSCSFAWDWGPSVPTLGIDHIGILSYDSGYIQDLKCIVHSQEDGTWKVAVTAYLHWDSADKPSLSLDLVTVDINGHTLSHVMSHEGPWTTEFETEFVVTLPPWRVVGTHDEVEFNTLYKVLVTLKNENQTVGRAIGFRKIELIRKFDDGATEPTGLPSGESFYFQVNGTPVFAKGSNYIPPGVFHQRSRENARKLVKAARAAGMNCLRIWGGGRYEDESFYLECDRLGILLWHDMMFACSLFPGADPSFLALVRTEVRHQLRRLAGHPSIALWAANNENEELLQQIILEKPSDKERLLIDYQRLYIDTIMPTFYEEFGINAQVGTSSVPFWPSSPSNGVGEWGVPGEQKRGDVHYWGVWHGNKPFEAFQEVIPRFCSEFGFQSAPSYFDLVKSLYPAYSTSFNDEIPTMDSIKLNWTSPEMEFLQRSPARGNLGVVSQMMSHMRLPATFKRQVWASQLLQGLAMQNAVSCWRRLQPYCMGSLYWQLNDIWTGMSWSTINHSGVWKLSQYFVKRAFGKHNLSFKFLPSKTSPPKTPSTEDAPFNKDDSIQLWITSDYHAMPHNGQTVVGDISVEFWSLSSSNPFPMWSAKLLDVGYNTVSQCIWSQIGFEFDKHDVIARAVLKGSDDLILAETEHFFLPMKRLNLQNADLALELTQTETGSKILPAASGESKTQSVPLKTTFKAIISSKRVALYATLEELATNFESSPWSQNGLIVYPGEIREVSCTVDSANTAVKLDLDRVRQFLERNLVDVFSASFGSS
jgi:beta-mannosidase